MIDRPRRDRLAELLHAFISGMLTNRQFNDQLLASGLHFVNLPVATQDRLLAPMIERAWCIYSDGDEYRHAADRALPKEARHEVLRWIMFLRSDREYEWPAVHFTHPLWYPVRDVKGLLLTICSFGRWNKRRFETFKQAGNFDVWPFFHAEHFCEAYRAHCPLVQVA